jgi:hypothetical protein
VNASTGEERGADPRVPRLLLDHHRPTQPEAITGPRPAVTHGRPLPSNRESEPNEVHVHIARIEVTAVPASTSLKRSASTPARKSASLEEYLAQRHRRVS